MAATVHISLQEYLSTDYEPDCDYVDGLLEERNVGKNKHSETQSLVIGFLLAQRTRHRCRVLTEQRVRVSEMRIRIPDVCLVEAGDRDEVIERPPLLCVEVLSPEDRWSRVQVRLDDYLAFGVGTVWVVDPYDRTGWMVTPDTPIAEAHDGYLRCVKPDLEVKLAEILPEE